MSALPKPVLRGHLRKKGLSMLFGAVTCAVTCGALYKFLVAMPRENTYNEYVRTYDVDKHYDELVKYGLLKSVKMTKGK